MEQTMYWSKIENMSFCELESVFSIAVSVDLVLMLLLT